jgi:CHAT domain-containing protein
MKKIFLLIFFLSTIFSQEQYPSSCASNEWIQIPEEQHRIINDFIFAERKFWNDGYPQSGDKISINIAIENIENMLLLIEKYDNLKPSIEKDPNFNIKVFEEERERMLNFFIEYYLDISIYTFKREEYKNKGRLYDQFPEKRQLQLTQLDIRILVLVEGYYNKLEERASKSIINGFNVIHYEYMLAISKDLADFYRSTVFAAENGNGNKEGFWHEKTFDIYQEIYNHADKEFLLKNIGKISTDCLPSTYIIEEANKEMGGVWTNSDIENYYPHGFFEIEYITFLDDYIGYKKNRVGIVNHHEIFKAYDLALNGLEGLSLSEISKIIQRKNELISGNSSDYYIDFITGFDRVGEIPKHNKNEFLYCMYAEILGEVDTINTYYSLIGDVENELESLVYALDIYKKIDEDLLFELADTNPMLGISYIQSISLKLDYFEYRAIDLSLMDKDVFGTGMIAGFHDQKGRVILKEMDEYYHYIRRQFDKIENTIQTKYYGWQQEGDLKLMIPKRLESRIIDAAKTSVNDFGAYVELIKDAISNIDKSIDENNSMEYHMIDGLKSQKKADNDDWIPKTSGMIIEMYFDDLDAPKNSSEEKERRERIDSFLRELGETRDSFFKVFRDNLFDTDNTNLTALLESNESNKLLDNDPYSKSENFARFPDSISFYLDLAKSLKSREEYQNILNYELKYILNNFTVEDVQKDYDFSIAFGSLFERIDKDIFVYNLENKCDNHVNGPYRIVNDNCGLFYFSKRIIALDSLRGILTEKNVNQSLGEYSHQYDKAMNFSTKIYQLRNNQALIFYDFSKIQAPGRNDFRFVYQYEIFMIKRNNKGNLLFTNYSSSLEDKKELINLFYRFGLVNSETEGGKRLLVDEKSRLFTSMLQIQTSTPNHAALFEIDDEDTRTIFYTNYTALNLSLWTLLVKPIISFIDESDYLTIIPDPVISNIPFETLLDWDDENIYDSWNTLLDRFISINYANSFGEFVDNVSTSNTPKKLNLFGNIDYESTSNDLLSKREYKSLNNLKWSKNEIYDIDKVFKGSVIIEGDQATETKLKETDFSRLDAIHFAIHGINVQEDYQKSALVFLSDSSNDGMLTFEEIIKFDLNNIDLITLSACSTNRSKLFSGFSHLSLQHAFKLAGAKNVISTMWEIDDKASYYFMKEYYQLLKKHKNPSITLSITKRHFIKKYPQYASPHYWGAFVIYGSY